MTSACVAVGTPLYMFNTGRVRPGARYSGGSATMQLWAKSMTESRYSDRHAKRKTALFPHRYRIRRDNDVADDCLSRSACNWVTIALSTWCFPRGERIANGFPR